METIKAPKIKKHGSHHTTINKKVAYRFLYQQAYSFNYIKLVGRSSRLILELLRISYWQGQKDSNPRHAVLETAA
ncbi:hypothetical protein, partial [Ruminococcus sp.]|uniref:hypothetical protein n=1 Tax=Ruminococcus sp. TaxID=41978 RepID=UPI0025ED530B